MGIKDYLNERKIIVENALDKYLPKAEGFPSKVHEAMRYSIFAGGKRIRPILTLAVCEMLGGSLEQALPTACAIECIHTYSLIHDDLPCMDDDDLRRGIPTCHKKYGEAIAVLAGDALLTHAFQLLAKNNELVQLSAEKTLQIISDISHACGTSGLIGGQIIDLESENKKVDQATLHYIHQHKTGALITSSIRSGAIIGNSAPDELKLLTKYGELLGLVFQITDDILDIEGDFEHLGKTPGKDKKSKKATFPALYGLQESKMMAQSYAEQAVDLIKPFGEKAKDLTDIAYYILNRDK